MNSGMSSCGHVVVIFSGGEGEALRGIKKQLPDRFYINNTGWFGSGLKIATHRPFTVAPIDVDQYKDCDFSKGCWTGAICGISYWKGSFFPCNPSVAIDRVMQLGGGAKTLKEISNKATLRSLFKKYCRFCGMFMANPVEFIQEERISPTWQKAFEKRKLNGRM